MKPLRTPAPLPILFAAILLPAAFAHAADPVADLDAQYQNVLLILKKPPITGVLVTEVEPDSPTAAAGLKAGDIITEYYGSRITTLQSLRERVADAIAHRVEDDNGSDRIMLRVHRGEDAARIAAIQLPRQALGIRAIDVVAGVPGPRNPPPSLRGSIALSWKPAIDNITSGAQQDGGALAMKSFLLVADSPDDPAATTAPQPQEQWTGWQIVNFSMDQPDLLTGTLEVYHIDAPDTALLTDHSTYTFHVRLGDYKTTPAFVLEDASATYSASDQPPMTLSATRVGDVFRATVPARGAGAGLVPRDATETHEYSAPLNAIIEPALPLVAAAMPHDADAALGLALLSVHDFLPRPGYVLAARGQSPVPPIPGTPPAAPENAWRVDLVHCGVTVESWWFSEQRRLLCSRTEATQPLICRRVDSARDAATSMLPRPATPPVTRPAH